VESRLWETIGGVRLSLFFYFFNNSANTILKLTIPLMPMSPRLRLPPVGLPQASHLHGHWGRQLRECPRRQRKRRGSNPLQRTKLSRSNIAGPTMLLLWMPLRRRLPRLRLSQISHLQRRQHLCPRRHRRIGYQNMLQQARILSGSLQITFTRALRTSLNQPKRYLKQGPTQP
jgi:hypothetical protein